MIQIDNFTFYNSDCLEIMKTFSDNQFDLAIVDPPYGIMKSTNPQLRKAKMGKFDWDIIPSQEYFDNLFRCSKNVFIFGAQYFNLKPPKTTVFWDKQNFNPLYGDGEICYYYGKLKDMRTAKRNLGGVIKLVHNEKQDKIHPTQKPVGLYDKILKLFSDKNMSILDIHLGSASIALAVDKVNKLDNMNLSLTGIELDSDYFNAAIDRFRKNRTPAVLPFL